MTMENYLKEKCDKLMEEFKKINPTDKPLLWALQLLRDSKEMRDAALLKLAMDCELNPPRYQDIKDQAVYEFTDLGNGIVVLHALLQPYLLDE